MTNRASARVIASSLIISTSVVGCTGTQMQQRPALASGQSTSVEQALGARDYDRALQNAERLVAARPDDAASRTLLGRAYLANGRYMSARTAFEDAISLGARDARTIISLALVRTGLGDAIGARAMLSDHISHVPAADYGLGMAVAGDANEGVRALLEAVRQPDADAKTRQNLAYALALSGNWAQARLVAGQDLDGSQVQQRLTHWAATAQGTAMPQRVAALIGVAPRADDAGLPAQLALNKTDGTALAAVAAPRSADILASAPEPVTEQLTAPVSPEIAPAPQQEVAAIAAPRLAEAAVAPRPAFTVQPITPFVPAPSTPVRRAAAKSITSALPAISAAPRGASDWVVQIGAYDSSAVAEDGWKKASARLSALRGYRKLSSTVSLNGQVWHRLALSGFSGRQQAVQFCATLNRQGQGCFVRQDENLAANLRMASRAKTAKFASR